MITTGQASLCRKSQSAQVNSPPKSPEPCRGWVPVLLYAMKLTTLVTASQTVGHDVGRFQQRQNAPSSHKYCGVEMAECGQQLMRCPGRWRRCDWSMYFVIWCSMRRPAREFLGRLLAEDLS
jgi:hypothetical protein